jgi:hypothetical protein
MACCYLRANKGAPPGAGHTVLTTEKAQGNVQAVGSFPSCWHFPPCPLQEMLHLERAQGTQTQLAGVRQASLWEVL